jgi:hypothetical protein
MSCPPKKSMDIKLCVNSDKMTKRQIRAIFKDYPAISIHPESRMKLNTKTIKIKKRSKKLKIKVKVLKKNKPTSKVTRRKKCKKRCPRGSHCNRKTGRCNKRKKKTTREKSEKKTRKKKTQKKTLPRQSKKHIDVIPNTTPSLNKELKLMTSPSVKKEESQVKDYSPSIHRALHSLRSLSPHPDIFDCVKNREIKVPTKHGPKCVGWKTKKAQKVMLDNVLSKKTIPVSQMVAPKQSLANCWFNTFFVTFFMSDRGRKFNRVLREMMITGNLIKRNKPAGKIMKQLQWPFFLLNKYIDASLRGTSDPSRFAELMDTNTLIRQIYNVLVKRKKTPLHIAKTGKPSNPLTFYQVIINYLYNPGENPIWSRTFHNILWKQIHAHLLKGAQHNEMPHVLYVVYGDTVEKKKIREENHTPLSFTLNAYPNATNARERVVKYVLDAAILRDTKKRHFSAYLTINGKEYGFDGESFSRMEPFQWKNKLYQKTQWRFAMQYDTFFNFTDGYQILMYYRVQ